MTDFSSWLRDFVDKMQDPVWQAEHELRLAEYERTRTDPWVLYCRHCGDIGKYDTEAERAVAASEHLALPQHVTHPNKAQDSSGRLLHIWTYPELPSDP